MGIGPTRPAWKAGILPLNYTRTSTAFTLYIVPQKMSTILHNFFKVFQHFFWAFFYVKYRYLPKLLAWLIISLFCLIGN